MFFTGERSSKKDVGGINAARYRFVSEKGISNKKILELGCGLGYGAFYLARGGAKRIIAIDSNKSAIAYANSNYKNKKIQFMQSRLENTTLEAKYDIVIAFEIIEHLVKPEVLIKFCLEHINKKGRLFISTPNRLLSSYNGNKPSNPYHVKEYYPKEFKKYLNKYFDKVILFGIFLNKEKKKKESKVKSGIRWKISSLLTRKRFVRRLVNYLPELPKRFFTGERILKYSSHDFFFSENSIDNADYLIAICER